MLGLRSAAALEDTQYALMATVRGLYSMARHSLPWTLGEPGFNNRGQPIIHNIAQKLGCIRPCSDMNLPLQSTPPKDVARKTELASQLEGWQKAPHGTTYSRSSYDRSDWLSSSKIESKQDYRLSRNYLKLCNDKSGSRGVSVPSSSSSSQTMLQHWPGSTSTGLDQVLATDVDASACYPSLQNKALQGWTSLPVDCKPQQLTDPTMDLFQAGLQGVGLLNLGLPVGDFSTTPDILLTSNPYAAMEHDGLMGPAVEQGGPRGCNLTRRQFDKTGWALQSTVYQ